MRIERFDDCVRNVRRWCAGEGLKGEQRGEQTVERGEEVNERRVNEFLSGKKCLVSVRKGSLWGEQMI